MSANILNKKYISVTTYKDKNIISDSRCPFEAIAKSEYVDVKINTDGEHFSAVCTAKKDINDAAIRLIFSESDWDVSNYIFAPAALYNGNRFKCEKKQYPPMLGKEESEKYKGEVVITDVPRLSPDGNGCVQLNVGDLAFPCFGFFSQKSETGFLVFFKQENELGNFGITIKENAENRTAEFILSSPCVRTPYKYGMCTTETESDDRPARISAGKKITFDFTEYSFKCENVQEFLRRFFVLRSEQGLPANYPIGVPWEYAYRLIEDKYNKRNWVEDFGFYKSSEAEASIFRQWQTGWVGGGMNTLPSLAVGNDESKKKSVRTLDFMFTKVQHKSGFLYGIFCDGRHYGDNPDPEKTNIVLVRKNTDALYYTVKQLILLKNSGKEINPLWHEGVKKLADAFISFYKKNGEISQFIDMDKNEPYTYGSASGGLISAGLVLCGKYFGIPEYIAVAEELAEKYYADYIAKGFSNGGPGEILSSPDSESAFALLESFVILYRNDNNEKWLRYAEDTAALCASWCVGYDYHYKDDTQFAERKISTVGAVWANVQNKHAAPGICTMSGESLFHLYRATGNMLYLNLLKDISHNITQFVSTPNIPMYASYIWNDKNPHSQKIRKRRAVKTVRYLSSHSKLLKKILEPLHKKIINPIGRINERVNLSDWEGTENVGEVPLGSCWCEVSTMLTYFEIPAVYIRTDTELCFTLDHIESKITTSDENTITAEFYNPTKYDAAYRIYVNNSADSGKPIPPEQFLNMTTVFLHSGERKILKISKR